MVGHDGDLLWHKVKNHLKPIQEMERKSHKVGPYQLFLSGVIISFIGVK